MDLTAWDPREDAWLAGFTDGEACFNLYTHKWGTVPRFAINLRADDGGVLEALQVAFGGAIRYQAKRDAFPECRWTVVAKRDLAGLVAYFDRFQLRAKKARDYTLWRQAVRIYCAHSGRDERLVALRLALMAGRAFAADEPDPIRPFSVQMGLGIES